MRTSIRLLISVGWLLTASLVAPPTTAAPATTAGKPAAAASLPTPAATKTAAAPPADPDQIVCVREENTGSRIAGHRECHTRAEWAALKNEALDRLQMRPGGSLQRSVMGSSMGR